MLSLENQSDFLYPDKHDIQAMIYTAFGDSKFGVAHANKGFKYFTYSDCFYTGEKKATLILSSPLPRLIDTILDWFKEHSTIQLGIQTFNVKRISVIKPKLNNEFISGSPIVLYQDSKSGKYFSFRDNGDLSFFLDRLKNNALKKYEFFSGIKYELEDSLFDEVELKREVAVPVTIRGNKLMFIGSMWNSLVKHNIEDHAEFYEFIMEVGLGEKNSLGFGFINPIRRDGS